jgi:hypothetical protein
VCAESGEDLNTIRTGQRGFIAQTPARNLLCRLDRYREDVLRFAHDFHVPFDNNLVERDSSLRSSAGA